MDGADKTLFLLVDDRLDKGLFLFQIRVCIRRLADQDATLSVQGGSVTVTLDATLTDEEREAVETAVRWLEPYPQVAATLRRLLERLT